MLIKPIIEGSRLGLTVSFIECDTFYMRTRGREWDLCNSRGMVAE